MKRFLETSLIVLLVAVGVAGCGFTPLYGQNGITSSPDVVDEFANVSIRSLPNREGMKLRQVLREELQPRGMTRAVYDLDVNLATQIQELGIRKDATSSRANMVMVATFRLNEGGRPVFGDRVQSIVSYNILDDQYATVASQADAENRGIKQLGAEIKTRLGVYFHARAKSSTAKP